MISEIKHIKKCSLILSSFCKYTSLALKSVSIIYHRKEEDEKYNKKYEEHIKYAYSKQKENLSQNNSWCSHNKV